MNTQRLVAFACIDPKRDPCAHLIYKELTSLTDLHVTSLMVDKLPVLRALRPDGAVIDIVRTAEVVSHDYHRYLPPMKQHWSDCEAALVLNWHEGPHAPDRIFAVHTTGDVATGVFGPSAPDVTRGVLLAVEAARRQEGLMDWRATTEATHWSGVVHGMESRLISEYRVPVLDMEVGSSPAAWCNTTACRVLARATLNALSQRVDADSALFIGGVHFEPTWRTAILDLPTQRISFGHILANQWLNGGAYAGETGVSRILAAAESMIGGVRAIYFHDSVKGPIKQAVREAGQRLGVPVHVHRKLREPPTGSTPARASAPVPDARGK